MQDKIGLILCNCGSHLEEKIDFDFLIDGAKKLSKITKIKKVDFLCKNTEKILQEFKGKVGKILFACCSERSSLTFNEDIIEKFLERVGIDKGMYEVANIREQCAWIHEDRDKTTKKAMDLITMAYEKLKLNSNSYELKDLKQEVLVIGGGVAGVSAAQTLSKLGVKSTLVEEKPFLGGHAQQVSFLWHSQGSPAFCYGECVIPVINRDLLLEDNVSILTQSKISWIEKKDGNFYAEIQKSPEYVNPDLCICCGKCAEVCPIEIPNPFELSQKKKKAIDKECDVAIPDTYVLDDKACNRCGECVSICPTSAINLNAKPKLIQKEFGAVVFATGFNTKDMSEFTHLAYDKPNVITLMEFERMIGNRFYGKPPMSVTFIMCQKDKVGYCSRLCCQAVAKHAFRMSKFFMGTETIVIYKDLRTTERLGEILKNSSEEAGVEYINAEVKKIEGDDWLTIYTDKGEFETQLVVLAEPLIPSSIRVAKMLGLQLDKFGFPMEVHPKIPRPLNSYVERVFLAGAAKGFKDVQESIESGNMAGLRAYEALKGKKQRFVASTILEKCSKCGMCIPICPHSAISAREKEGGRTIFLDPKNIEEKDLSNIEIKIDSAFCKACGLCYTTCPSKAISFLNLEEYQILKMADRAFENLPEGEPRILAFLCYWCAYGAADMMGIKGIKATENFRTIRIRCSGSISPEVLSEILFQNKADGIVVAGCPPDNCHHLWGNYVTDKRIKLMQDTLSEFGIDSSRLRWEYIGVPQWDLMAKVLNFMDKALREKN
jgi:heterodisulfide reductase subunit A